MFFLSLSREIASGEFRSAAATLRVYHIITYLIFCLLTYLLIYLLTPWSRVLLEKLMGSAASQEIPRIFGTRRFITVSRTIPTIKCYYYPKQH